MNEAQQEFKEYEVDIVSIVGRVAYERILLEYQHTIAKQLTSDHRTRGSQT